MLWMGRRCLCWIGLLQLKNVAGNMQVHNVYLLIGVFAYWGGVYRQVFHVRKRIGWNEPADWRTRMDSPTCIYEQVQQLHAVLATSSTSTIHHNSRWYPLLELDMTKPGSTRSWSQVSGGIHRHGRTSIRLGYGERSFGRCSKWFLQTGRKYVYEYEIIWKCKFWRIPKVFGFHYASRSRPWCTNEHRKL